MADTDAPATDTPAKQDAPTPTPPARAQAAAPAAQSASATFVEYLGPSGRYNVTVGDEAYSFPLGETVEVPADVAEHVQANALAGHRFAVRDEAAPSQANTLAPTIPPMTDAPLAASTSYEGGQRGGVGVGGA